MRSADEARRSRPRRFLQRSFDLVVSGLVLLLTLPIVVFAALAIKLSSPHGPVLVREVRVGRDDELFEMLALRTTTSCEPAPETSGDQRVTAVGRLLRTCSLDQLPRWWNVVRGDMSVVGPEPPVPSGSQRTPGGRGPLRVSPGVTGVWRSTTR